MQFQSARLAQLELVVSPAPVGPILKVELPLTHGLTALLALKGKLHLELGQSQQQSATWTFVVQAQHAQQEPLPATTVRVAATPLAVQLQLQTQFAPNVRKA